MLLIFSSLLTACAAEKPQTTGLKTDDSQLLNAASFQPSCPKGITDDPYPGLCAQYTDKNNDNLCDLSQ
jgi:hypothetical protein